MCGRFVQIIDIDLFVKRFGVRRPAEISIESNFNVAAGDLAYVITDDQPDQLQAFTFGLTPSWARKPMYLINARSEGDNNPGNDLHYSGTLGIADKPSFRKAIHSQRCLIIANAFYEGPAKEKLNKPYVIKRRDEEVFCFAGIWDTWRDSNTGQTTHSFSIITTVSNQTTQSIGHPRSPVILAKKDEKRWLNPDLSFDQVAGLLKPFPGEFLKAEAVSLQVKDPKNKNRELMIPIELDKPTEYGAEIKKDLRLEGMGSGKRKKDPPAWQGNLF